MAQSSDFSDEPTARPEGVRALGRLRLLVFGDDTFVTHPLPMSGEVTIGRGEDADVQIDDPSISRLHVRLRISGLAITLEDLGSFNGTAIRGRRLGEGVAEPVSAGEVIDIGQTMVIVQHSSAVGPPRRFWTHGYFEIRLEEECERARASGRTFAVLRVRAGEVADAEAFLADRLRPFDVVAHYAPGEYEILLVDADPAKADRLSGDLEDSLGAEVSVAIYPADGRDAGALVAHASERARGASPGGPAIVVENSAMQQIHRLIERIAPSDISVLILGETGVGKEVIAEAVHTRSSRHEGPLLRLNCAALSESLLESELFGHEKGAFSGADRTKVGLLESASRGTVFLDEIGELPMSMQVKLLRVLEERRVRRVGGLESIPVDIRLVSATNRDLEAEIDRGRFRMDLYYRLNGIAIVIPPLRERMEEIIPLARSFIEKVGAPLGRSAPVLSDEAIAMLLAYGWPGNIRELKNVMERAVLLADDRITKAHLPADKMSGALRYEAQRELTRVPPRRGASSLVAPAPIPPTADGDGLRTEIEELEKRRIVEALERCGGVQTKAAKMLGMSRGTFLARLDAYGIPRPRKTGSRERPGE
jgi:DNA-binding NtrC family response regulator